MKDKLSAKLDPRFSGSIEKVDGFRGETTYHVKKDDIARICQFLRDDEELSFDSLRDICGSDQFKPGDRFDVIYNLYSLKNKFRLRLKVKVSDENLHVPSVTGIWPTANFEERETFDMFGIIFDGHPDLRRIYMPEEFEYHPLRKDFPLMGIPGSIPLPRK